MPKPKNTLRPVKLTISLPEDLDAEIRLAVLSPITARIRSGALSEFFTIAARNELARMRAAYKEQSNVQP